MSNGSLNYALTLDDRQFVAATGRAANATRTLTNSKQLFKSAADIATTSAMAFGNAQIASVAFGAQQAARQVGALKNVMEGLGVGLAGGGLIAAGFAAALATIAKGVETFRAEMEQLKSEDAFKEQFETLRDKLIPKLQEAVRLGKLDPDVGRAQIARLQMMDALGTTSAERQTTLSRTQEMLGIVLQGDLAKDAKSAMTELMRVLRIGLLEGAEREKAELRERIQKQKSEISKQVEDLAKFGITPDAALEILQQIMDKGFAEIEAKYAKKNETAPGAGGLGAPRPAVTAIEQLGFSFRGGLSQGSDLKATADNTRRTAVAVERIANNPPSTGNFNNLD